MNTLVLAASLALASATAATAAGKTPNYPTDWLGVWCQAKVEYGWVYYERGKCNGAVNSIVFSPNGDYRRIAPLSERVQIVEECKAISYYRGWLDYKCVIGNGALGSIEKRYHKWTLEDGYAGALGLSNAKWAQQ
jgi:hypothetical protein